MEVCGVLVGRVFRASAMCGAGGTCSVHSKELSSVPGLEGGRLLMPPDRFLGKSVQTANSGWFGPTWLLFVLCWLRGEERPLGAAFHAARSSEGCSPGVGLRRPPTPCLPKVDLGYFF